MASAAVVMLDDFESYADDAALQAAWVMNPSSDIQNETVENVLNGQSMLIENHTAGVGWTQTKYQLPGSVWDDHGVNLHYAYGSGATGITMTFAIPSKTAPGWEYLDGSGGDVFLSLYDVWGQKVFSASYPGDVTPSGTGWPNGIVWDLDFATYTVAGMNLENVYQITVGVNNGWYQAGGLFVDDIGIIVPEPATMGLLALGGLLLRRKK